MLKEIEESPESDGTNNKSNLRVLEVMAEDCGDLAANFAIPAMPAVIVFADGEVKNPHCVLCSGTTIQILELCFVACTTIQKKMQEMLPALSAETSCACR